MRANNKGLSILIVALSAGFLYGLWRLYELRFTAGDIYPAYSSLRADPLGAKALYESLRQIPGISTTRNYLAPPNISKGKFTVLFLGEDPFLFEATPEDQLKEYEALASSGARVVIAMRPVNRLPEAAKPETKKAHELPAIEKRWKIQFGYITHSAKQAEEDSGLRPKMTALYFRTEGKVFYKVERPFGAGAIVLLANCYPLSNEALAGDRDTKLLAWTLGASHQVVFDEHHLGLAESAGVVTLARKFHLEGLAAALLLLLVLFIWKNSTSLLPPRPEPTGAEDSVAAEAINSGLANLLRRNIASKALMATCLEQWEGSQHGGRYYSQAKIERVRNIAQREGDVVETYRKVSKILSERSEG